MFILTTPTWWYKKNILTYLLLPFSYVYQIIIWVRKFYYEKIYRKTVFPVPIIVVGNITVGGTGKTPLVIWLANLLVKAGLRPGIVSRGYLGKLNSSPIMVSSSSKPSEVGDEAILLFKNANAPVVVCKSKVSAVKYLLAKTRCNIVISDDGLQHYALNRNLEIVVIDGELKFGNTFCLPAGPLRESVSRLREVDFVVVNGRQLINEDFYHMRLIPQKIVNLKNATLTKDISAIQGLQIAAYAGIGNPDRFFKSLRDLNLNIVPNAFPDHYKFEQKDFINTCDLVLMTEKDAVKCFEFALDNFWYLPVQAVFDNEFGKRVLEKIHSKVLNKN